MGWAVGIEEEFAESDWNLWFSELGIESEKLKSMKPY